MGSAVFPQGKINVVFLGLADGFSLAFESAAPSFHLFDLAVGVAGAVALRLMGQ